LDEGTAQMLESCEAKLVVAQTLFKSGNVTEAKQALNQAQGLARAAAESGRAEVTVPGTLNGLKRWQPHGKGYWSSHV
jgi:hypothetical protein